MSPICDTRPLTQAEKEQAEIYKALNWSLLYGVQGYGKDMAAAEKIRARALANFPVPSIPISADRIAKPKLPQKICNYRKPKVYWFGESGNNVPYSVGTRSSHWAVVQGQMMHYKLEKYFAEYSEESRDTAEFFKELGDDIETFRGKRFIGISEPTETEQMDSEFLKRITGDVWTETRTLDASSKSWVPQGKIFVSSGKPLKINEKSKETIERVKRIEYP